MKRHTEADASEEGGQGESSAAILECVPKSPPSWSGFGKRQYEWTNG